MVLETTPNEQHLASLRAKISEGMDRRAFLRTLATAGYSLGIATFLGVEDFLSVDDEEVPIVTALVRTDPDDPFSLEPRTRPVPARWYANVSKAFELNELLAQSAITGYLGSAVVPGRYADGTATITVEVSMDAHSVRELFDRVVDGVRIDVDEIRNLDDLEEGSFDHGPRFARDSSVSAVPAGVACETAQSIATLSPALHDPESQNVYFSTAEHAFLGEESVRGEPVGLQFEDGESVTLGEVANAYPVADVATIEPTNAYEPSRLIEGQSPYDVRGQYTRFGLADLVARGEPIQKVGAITGQTSGYIQGIDAVSCLTSPTCRRGQLRWGEEADMTDGDSGSVSFHYDERGDATDVLVAGFNNARTWWPGQSYVWGISAYHFTEQYGYHF